MQEHRAFSRDLKLEAVRLLDHGDKSAAELAREIVIKRNQLLKWKEQLTEKGEVALPGHERPAGDQKVEIVRLERVTEEREMLKNPPRTLLRNPGEILVRPGSL